MQGDGKRIVKRKSAEQLRLEAIANSRPKKPVLLLGTTVVRNINKQWRILLHHAVRVETAPFAGNGLNVKQLDVQPRSAIAEDLKRSRSRGKSLEGSDGTGTEKKGNSVRDALDLFVQKGFIKKIPGKVSKKADGEGFEKVIRIDDNLRSASSLRSAKVKALFLEFIYLFIFYNLFNDPFTLAIHEE